MASTLQPTPKVRWKLPPLILHPFTGPAGPERVLASSRANLMLQGLLPNDHFSAEDLENRVLEGRSSEIGMLYYVGKDLHRWMEQCVEFVDRTEELRKRDIRIQSFAALLIESPPAHVREKLHQWGVVNFRALFSRALGLYAVFGSVPDVSVLSPNFIMHYYRYADHLYACQQQLVPFQEIDCAEFEFQMYASREYATLLERQWEGDITGL
jgi:hypothetical protein